MEKYHNNKGGKPAKTMRPEELPREYQSTGKGRIPSDVQGSYTGVPLGAPGGIPGEDGLDQPVQDADDL